MKNNNNSSTDYYYMSSDLKFKVSEAYREIRTNITFSLMKKGCRTIVISSANPAEGKSTLSVNIAISMAQTDARVLLIDTDLRRPTVYRFLNLPNAPGLTNYLGGMNTLDEVVHETPYHNLHVICAGSLVPNPAEILTSEQFAELLESLQQQYDYIFIDSTPLNIVADTLPVVKKSDGLILVIKERKTTYKDVDAALKKLQFINAKILGMVISGAKSGKQVYYNYYSEDSVN